jgi:multidrug efflux pump subunit AcrB
MLNRLLEHHILANLTFLLVMVIGWMAYFELPREQDPSVNFNWVEVWTYWPGAAAVDVEKRVTEPLEEGIKRVEDVRYVSSVSREGDSKILVRFEDLSAEEFDTRLADLRREVLAKVEELPRDALQPEFVELTSANAFPTTKLIAWAESDGTVLQRRAQKIQADLRRMEGVDHVLVIGARDPELRVEFLPERLVGLGVSPVDLADSVSAYFRDLAAGKVVIGDQRWLVRLAGTSSDPTSLERFPVVTAEGELPLRAVAEVTAGVEDPVHLVRFDGRPAVLFSLSKKERANNLELLNRVKGYIEEQNRWTATDGVRLNLLDDQTAATRKAIEVMESNALIGLVLVIVSVGLFLGLRTAVIASIGIPFVLAGTFLVVLLLGQTLNTTVLLAVVISLGMLVDDAVVVVEAIQFHLAQGKRAVQAAQAALREVALPVTTAVLTTIAAFLPLILMPGVLGDFMRVVPVVVAVALLLSLVEAFWMLPSHMISFRAAAGHSGRIGRVRGRIIRSVKRVYLGVLVAALRRPVFALGGGVGLLVAAGLALSTGMVRVDFFATDFHRLFYVNVEMPAGTTLDKTLETTSRIERIVADEVEGQARSIVSYAGKQITDKEVLSGDERGQVFVSLMADGEQSVDEVIARLRPSLAGVPGPRNVSFVLRKTGPPTTSPVSIKVRGDDIGQIRQAVDAVKQILLDVPGVSDITDDDFEGGTELLVRLNADAITRSGVHPAQVSRLLRLFATGEQVGSMQYEGEKLQVRLLARPEPLRDIDQYLNHPVSLPSGGEIALGELLEIEVRRAESNIRHHDFRRAVTVEANLDPDVTDTLRANRAVEQRWTSLAAGYPGVSLDFSGELDDVQESLGSMLMLFLLGMGLIYLILGTQFKSYSQPLIVLAAVPMAFVGVVFGLGISGNPLSLFTLYGVVALAGIAANDAIVLIATANRQLAKGGTVAFAMAHAARRRFLPIIITSTTTIAGLYSLAVGLGGHSLMWAPVATAIVWGLVFSTLLTLLLVPVIYLLVVGAPREAALETGTPALPGGLAVRPTLREWLIARLSPSGRQARRDIEDALTSDALRSLYAEGVAAMRANDLEVPVRCFERLAASAPDSLELNLLAAGANIRLQQARGWDIGYSNRARRYLVRARTLAPRDGRILSLTQVLDELDETADQ